MNSRPLISVIIPTFNRGELLRKALASVLEQTSDAFEVIVSDNCSEDNTPEVVAEFSKDRRVIYSRNDRNLGMVGNWRKAIYELARGEWFILMSDDDYLTDRLYLSKAINAIEKHEPVFVYSGGVVHDAATDHFDSVELPFNGLISGELVFGSRGTVKPQDALLPTMVFRVDDARRLGFLTDPDNLSCDSELYLRLCTEGKVFAIPSPACVYVKHGGNLIYKIKTTRRLLDRNLDHLVNPLVSAIRCGFDQNTVMAFRENTKLDHSIASTFLRLKLHNEHWFRECRDRIAAKIPDIVSKIESSMRYRVKSLIIVLLRPIMRRRFPLSDSGIGEY